MTSPYPWLFFIALGILAGLLLDAEASVPFFILWGVAGVVLAVKMDNALKQRKDRNRAGPNSNQPAIGAISAHHDNNTQKQRMEFSRY